MFCDLLPPATTPHPHPPSPSLRRGSDEEVFTYLDASSVMGVALSYAGKSLGVVGAAKHVCVFDVDSGSEVEDMTPRAPRSKRGKDPSPLSSRPD